MSLAEALQKLVCPICISTLSDPFVTPCGHSYCHGCITKHLDVKQTCPSCSAHLTADNIYPNYTLATLSEHLHTYLEHSERPPSVADQLRGLLTNLEAGALTADELGESITVLQQRKRRLEVNNRAAALKLLLRFLESSLEAEESCLREADATLEAIDHDVSEVSERLHEVQLLKEKERSRMQYFMAAQESLGMPVPAGVRPQDEGPSQKLGKKMTDVMIECFDEFAGHYDDVRIPQPGQAGWDAFTSIFLAHTRHSKVEPLSEIDHTRFSGTNAIVSALVFSPSGTRLATTGNFQKVFVFGTKEASDGCLASSLRPERSIDALAKVASLTWVDNSDSRVLTGGFDGVVAQWDVETGQQMLRLKAHQKRVWTLDCVPGTPGVFVSGSDDCLLSMWDLRAAHAPLSSTLIGANVLSARVSHSGQQIAVGSAGQGLRVFDIRKMDSPRQSHLLSGHEKAISYVSFTETEELVSASTDSTLRLWDLHAGECKRVFRGHKNSRNFVGMSIKGPYIATGSESNEVVLYSTGVSRPMLSYCLDRAGSDSDADDERRGKKDVASAFVSALSWHPGQDGANMLAVANSQGSLQVLELK